ncbi:hypothetical protein ACVGXU_08380, partial [Enterobacter hormaechei]
PKDGLLVRVFTVSRSLCGSRMFRANGPMMNIHSLAGAIGMGLAKALRTPKSKQPSPVFRFVGSTITKIPAQPKKQKKKKTRNYL